MFCVSALLMLGACNFFENKPDEEVIARVHDSYLYKSDFLKVLPDDLAKHDSISFANKYINDWATKQILKQQATLNLSRTKQEEFERLAEEYRLDLYTNYFLDALIVEKLDTIVSKNELDTLYESSKGNFKLNDQLYKFRYISLKI